MASKKDIYVREFTIPMKLNAKKKHSVRFSAAKGEEVAVRDLYLMNFAAEDAKEIEVIVRVKK